MATKQETQTVEDLKTEVTLLKYQQAIKEEFRKELKNFAEDLDRKMKINQDDFDEKLKTVDKRMGAFEKDLTNMKVRIATFSAIGGTIGSAIVFGVSQLIK